MSGKNFKDLLENSQKMSMSQKLFNAYQKNKKLRLIAAATMGGICSITFLTTYPGKEFPLQGFFKSVSAKTIFEFHYISN